METMKVTIICDDVLHWAETYEGPKFHAALLDPPYELSFMGKKWDASGISFRPETWAALARHLLPGAFIMAFAGTRGYHRMACALEDAGFIIHPAIGYVFGSGFPKATRIMPPRDDDGYTNAFDGHRYGLQAMKPAFEFIALAQVPYSGRPVDSITTTGAGALNIDGGRIGADTDTRRPKGNGEAAFPHSDDNWVSHVEEGGHVGKRWPPNFALCHTPDCERIGTRQVQGDARGACDGTRSSGFVNVGADNGSGEPNARVYGDETVPAYRCAEGCPVRALDGQTGNRSSGSIEAHHQRHVETTTDIYGAYANASTVSYGDSGGASRFFYTADWSLEVAEQLAHADPVRYEVKASRGERDAGLAGRQAQKRDISCHADQPSMDGGTGNPYNRGVKEVRNNHPTIKPIALARWLASLLLPPAAYAPRRLLVPFCGVASEMIGAMLAGWEEIVGIEQDAEHCAIGKKRLQWWRSQHQPSLFPERAINHNAVQPVARQALQERITQLSLFPG